MSICECAAQAVWACRLSCALLGPGAVPGLPCRGRDGAAPLAPGFAPGGNDVPGAWLITAPDAHWQSREQSLPPLSSFSLAAAVALAGWPLLLPLLRESALPRFAWNFALASSFCQLFPAAARREVLLPIPKGAATRGTGAGKMGPPQRCD